MMAVTSQGLAVLLQGGSDKLTESRHTHTSKRLCCDESPCSPSTGEAEAEGAKVPGQPGQLSNILSQLKLEREVQKGVGRELRLEVYLACARPWIPLPAEQ